MTRVILARNDVLTPFDLRAQILRVNVELSVQYRRQNFLSKKRPKVTLLKSHNLCVLSQSIYKRAK